MTDTTDTARLVATVRKTAADHQTVHSKDRARKALFMQCADALERLAAENAELRADLATHVPVLLEWLGENVTDDPAYLRAHTWASRVARKAAIDAAMAEGKGDDV